MTYSTFHGVKSVAIEKGSTHNGSVWSKIKVTYMERGDDSKGDYTEIEVESEIVFHHHNDVALIPFDDVTRKEEEAA